MQVKIKQERIGFQMPVKAHGDDACYDVTVCHIEKKSNDLVVCYLGFSTEIEKGYKGIIVPRSSQTETRWAMLNSPGQVDSGYRGEWMIKFTCLDHFEVYDFPFKIGGRVGQIYFEKELETSLLQVDELSDTERGTGGFGSTNK